MHLLTLHIIESTFGVRGLITITESRSERKIGRVAADSVAYITLVRRGEGKVAMRPELRQLIETSLKETEQS